MHRTGNPVILFFWIRRIQAGKEILRLNTGTKIWVHTIYWPQGIRQH
jgi:hypothetical protein